MIYLFFAISAFFALMSTKKFRNDKKVPNRTKQKRELRLQFPQRVDKVDTLGKTNEKAVRRGTATQTVRWYGNGAVTKHKSA